LTTDIKKKQKITTQAYTTMS